MVYFPLLSPIFQHSSIPVFHHFYPVKLFSISPEPWKWHKPGTIKRSLISIIRDVASTPFATEVTLFEYKPFPAVRVIMQTKMPYLYFPPLKMI